MWWLILLFLILCLGIIPLGFVVSLDQQNVDVWLKIGWFRLRLGHKKPKEDSKGSAKEQSFESKATVKNKRKEKSINSYASLLRPVFKFLVDFKRKLRVNDLQLQIVLGGNDPCDLSVNYGRTWIAISNLVPFLDRFFVIRKRNIDIACDFTSKEPHFNGKLDVSITIGRLLQIIAYHGIVILREYYKVINKAKDGATL